MFVQILESSANSLILELMLPQISFTYTTNSSGPKTLPCGTPGVTLTTLDSCPPTLTLCVRPRRNSLTQRTPEADSFVSNRSWGTKSQDLEKSLRVVKPVQSVKYLFMFYLGLNRHYIYFTFYPVSYFMYIHKFKNTVIPIYKTAPETYSAGGLMMTY